MVRRTVIKNDFSYTSWPWPNIQTEQHVIHLYVENLKFIDKHRHCQAALSTLTHFKPLEIALTKLCETIYCWECCFKMYFTVILTVQGKKKVFPEIHVNKLVVINCARWFDTGTHYVFFFFQDCVLVFVLLCVIWSFAFAILVCLITMLKKSLDIVLYHITCGLLLWFSLANPILQ